MTRIPIDDDNTEEHDQPGAGADDGGDAASAQAPGARDAEPAPGGADAQKIRAERDDLFDRLARATAEFKNTQKRIQTEADQRVQYANQSLIKSLLPVIDNFERALAVDPARADAGSILRGMQIVHDQWLAVLKQQQIEEIAPQPGTAFDPVRHEALMQQDSQYRVPTVVQLLQKGYSLHGRTLRPAQVAVSRTA